MVLEQAAELLELSEDTELSLLIVDNDTIRELNREYRNKDSATDVLSFPLEEEVEENGEPAVVGGPSGRMLGDIVISIERAEEQAKEYGHSLDRELSFLLIHGLLHLLGYDHEKTLDAEKIMRSEEKRILTAIGIGRG